jgi:hypothetical protein
MNEITITDEQREQREKDAIRDYSELAKRIGHRGIRRSQAKSNFSKSLRQRLSGRA